MVIHLIKGELSLNGSDAKRHAPGVPMSGPWVEQTAGHLGLEATLRSPGRPPKKSSSPGHASSRDNNVAPQRHLTRSTQTARGNVPVPISPSGRTE